MKRSLLGLTLAGTLAAAQPPATGPEPAQFERELAALTGARTEDAPSELPFWEKSCLLSSAPLSPRPAYTPATC